MGLRRGYRGAGARDGPARGRPLLAKRHVRALDVLLQTALAARGRARALRGRAPQGQDVNHGGRIGGGERTLTCRRRHSVQAMGVRLLRTMGWSRLGSNCMARPLAVGEREHRVSPSGLSGFGRNTYRERCWSSRAGGRRSAGNRAGWGWSGTLNRWRTGKEMDGEDNGEEGKGRRGFIGHCEFGYCRSRETESRRSKRSK